MCILVCWHVHAGASVFMSAFGGSMMELVCRSMHAC